MDLDQQNNNLMCGNERRIFRRDDLITLELEYLRAQMLQTTCQEIADLSTMLRNKCRQDDGLREVTLYPAVTVQSREGEQHRNIQV